MFKEGPRRFPSMASDLLEGEKVLAFDLETTGISTNRDQIVQLALIGTQADSTSVAFERLVKPRLPIPQGASNVHGIYNEDVRHAPTFAAIADEVHELIEGAVLVGHNVRKFDYAMLQNEFLRIGRLAPKPKAIMDTLEIVRRLKLPRPHNLGALCHRHGIRLDNAHTATADAAATMLLFWRLSVEHAPSFRRSLEELERWIVHGERKKDASDLGRGLNDLPPVDALGKIRRDEGGYIVAFGRHRGRYVVEINEQDPAYLTWLLSPKGIECEVTRATISEHLGMRP